MSQNAGIDQLVSLAMYDFVNDFGEVVVDTTILPAVGLTNSTELMVGIHHRSLELGKDLDIRVEEKPEGVFLISWQSVSGG